MDVRIGVTQAARELALELPDDGHDAAVAAIEAALSGAVDVLWLTDRKGRRVAVPSAKVAYVELTADNNSQRIGFGG